MYRPVLLTFLGIALACLCFAQQIPVVQCGQKEVTDKLLRENPALKAYQEQVEQQLQQYQLARKARPANAQRTTAIVTLPVVVHIIHNNGAENISDPQVLTGIQHLNEAFANTGYYDPADGVNTQIQFCMAQRDPAGNPTNGITRDVSPNTVMGGATYYSDDQLVKNTNRWNPSCYINIWLVRSIPGSVAGYAYLPSAHGTNLDGIVMEAAYFGSSYSNDVVVIHEMGHFLGLYHTFEGACKNDDCTKDGDKVCDTPPDQSTAGVACNTSMNSCSTDALSGFGTDVNDLKEDYMDYGNLSCMKVFTQGQADRMNWHIQNVRSSLLQCKSCLTPCPAPVTAGFTASGTSVTAGTTVTFTNSSVNAGTYSWYLNNVLQSTTTNHSYTFNTAGSYTIKLAAYSSNPLCDSAVKTQVITVTCPVAVHFTPGDTSVAVNANINFINTTTGASSYRWLIDGVPQSASFNFTHLFATPGSYRITLVAGNGACQDSVSHYVVVSNNCQLQTFQKTYGGQRNDFANDVRATADGGFILGGRTNSFGAGADDGYLVKIDNLGVVQWSRVYGGTGADIITRVIVTSDGGYLAVGQTKSSGFATGAAWVIKTDAAGLLQWSRQFGENTFNGEIANNVIETSDGGFAIVCRYNAAPTTGDVMVIKLNTGGNLLWSQVYDNGDTDQGSTILEDNGALLVSGYRRSSTYHDAFLMKLDQTNGNPLWVKAYDIDGRNNFMSAVIYKVGTTYQMHLSTVNDLTNTATSRNMILTVDNNGDAVNVKEIIAPDFMFAGSGMFVPTPDGGFVVQHNEDNTNSDFNLFKFSSTGVVQWAKKYPRAGLQLNYVLRATPDGGFISAGYHLPGGGSNDMYVVKTDGRGYTPGCDTALVKVTINTPPFTTLPFNWQTISTPTFTGTTPLSFQSASAATQTTPLCSGSSCITPPVLPIDSCVYTFQKIYTAPGNYNVFYIDTTADGGSVVAGTVDLVIGGPNQQNASTDAFAMKLTLDGQVQWAKRIGGNQYDEFRKIRPIRDGGFIAIGSTSSFSTNRGLYLVKLDAAGNVSWSKNFSANSNYGDLGLDVIETSDGGFVFTGTNNASPPFAKGIVAKTDATGTITWSKLLYRDEGVDIHSVVENADTLVLGADYWVQAENRYYGTLIKLNKNNGAILSSISFLADGRGNFANQVFKTATGFMVGVHIIDGDSYNAKQQGILRFGQNLNLLTSQKLSQADIDFWSAITPTRDSGFIATAGQYAFGNSYYLMKASQTGSFNWQKTYGNFPGVIMQIAANAQQYTNGSYISACTYHDPGTGANGKVHVIKTAPNGTTPGCRTDDYNNTITSPQVDVKTITWSNVSGFTYNSPAAVNSYAIDLPLTATEQCPPVTCVSTGIAGADSICISTDTFTYTLQRSGNCVQPVDWTIDPAYAQLIPATDSTVRIVFKKKGIVTLYANVLSPCKLIRDSLVITIFDTHGTVNLGPDIQLCAVSTYTLHAGPGFVSYEWQDGSTDSTFTAYLPGEYYVHAKDYCGNEYRDTVQITQAPPVAFDLGKDLELCRYDTLTLTAPGGFTNYRWSADYKINTAYGPSIRIFTDKDTLYSVIAERSPGCLVIDTIRVTVKDALPIHLGKDTSFCANNSIVLDAGPGFNQYTWSTGELSQQITAAAAGAYWIKATNASGCVSKDTLVVMNVYPLPVVNLGRDTILCQGNTYLFDAGSGFAVYEWQDGSAGATFTALQTGTYWVKVTDSHTCTNADTALITGIRALPAGYLADTAQLCEGQRVTLQSLKPFAQYRWYNNSNAPAITVAVPGNYWLKVTDSYGCSSSDTIEVVAKDCKQLLYLPNAFTPNNDQNNDVFKPVVSGFLESFRLTIYNRWGEKIFETIDAARGWNGLYKGKLQDTNSFVWTCQYKFYGTGQTLQTAKGTVTLVR